MTTVEESWKAKLPSLSCPYKQDSYDSACDKRGFSELPENLKAARTHIVSCKECMPMFMEIACGV